MLKRFMNLFYQDIKVVIRNRFLTVVLLLAFVIAGLINFVIPQNVKITPKELFFDNTAERVWEKELVKRGMEKDRFYYSRDELYKAVQNNKSSLGIMAEGSLENTTFTIIRQGTEPEEIINVLDATLENGIREFRNLEKAEYYEVEFLRPRSEPIPFNKNLIPVVLVFEVVMLGFLMIAVMIFQEKQEGSIRAYRVSPGGVLEYIFSKASVITLLGLIYGGTIVVLTRGLGIDYLSLTALIVLTSILITLMGLLLSVFFRNISEFFFIAIAIMMASGIPIIAYMYPSFAPPFMTWIPSYPVVFGVREILFPTGKEGFMAPLVWILLLENTVLFAASYWAVQRKLLRGGR